MLAEIALDYSRVRYALRRRPLTLVLAAQRTSRQTRGRDRLFCDDLSEARSLARAVTRTLRLLPGDTRCLTQSLVLIGLLWRREIQAKLVIGSRTTPGFIAHAWVECARQPVISAGGGLFERLIEL